ncbi:MAG: type VI secretion system tube protein Hcp [Actinomycetota bacterium]
MKRKIMLVGLIAAVAAVVAAAAAFAVSGGDLPADRTSGHVVIQGIQGGDPGSNSIAVESWSWGVSSTATAGGGGGGGTGRADLQELSIVKTVDKASPKLAEKCAEGQHIQQVVLTVDRPGGSGRLYMEYKLTDVIISSVQQGASGAAIPLETLTFVYREIELTYTTRDGEVVHTEIENTDT